MSPVDLTGQRFGHLVVTELGEPYRNSKGKGWTRWVCQCDCGNQRLALAQKLRSGHTQSCGCTRGESLVIDLVGQRFGRLHVVGRAPDRTSPGTSSRVMWRCICECGATKDVRGKYLRSGHTKSCGGGGACHSKAKPSGVAAALYVYRYYRRNAVSTGRTFELSLEQFLDLTQRSCFYCDTMPGTLARAPRRNGEFVYNGLDRFDSALGYTTDNVVPCCGTCNYMKQGLSASEFVERCRRIADHCHDESSTNPAARKEMPPTIRQLPIRRLVS